MQNFITWTQIDKWVYGTAIEAKWIHEKGPNKEFKVTVYFGPYADPRTGVSEILDLSLMSNIPEIVNLTQEGVTLSGQLTWHNKKDPSASPQILFKGVIVKGSVANVGLEVLIPVDVSPRTTQCLNRGLGSDQSK